MVPSVISSLSRRVAARISPRHRRWRDHLASLTLDPDALPRPLPRPGSDNFVICGCPRTGTSLLAAALYQPPSVVTVMEPWDGLRRAPADLFTSLREEIDGTGRLTRGRLDTRALEAEGRVVWRREGEVPHEVEVEPGYRLGVKWTAYWRFLGLLPDTKFLVCLRHPVEVVSSFREHGGRLADGLDYDVAFHRAMNDDLVDATRDASIRRVFLYDYVHEHVIPHLAHDNVMAVRYERWFDDPGRLVTDIGEFLGVPVPHVRARLQAPDSRASAEDREAVRRHCSTASVLGYDVGQSS